MSDHRLLFGKRGTARYISHLDLMRTFQRAFLRAGLEVWHTEGFNPHAFVSLPLPLSVGFSSDCELLAFKYQGSGGLDEVPARLNRALPCGIEVTQCYAAVRPIRDLAFVDYAIAMTYDTGVPADAAAQMQALLAQPSFVIEKPSKKAKSGMVSLDVIPLVGKVTFSGQGNVLHLRAVLSAQNPGLNPQVLINALTGPGGAPKPDFVSHHRNEILDANLRPFR